MSEVEKIDISSPRGSRLARKKLVALAETGTAIDEVLNFVSGIQNDALRKSFGRSVSEPIAESKGAELIEWIGKDKERISDYLDFDVVSGLSEEYPLRMILLAQRVCPLKPPPQPNPNSAIEVRMAQRLKYTNDFLCWFEKTVVSVAFRSLAQENTEEALKQIHHWDKHPVFGISGWQQILEVVSMRDDKMAIELIEKVVPEEQREQLRNIVGVTESGELTERSAIVQVNAQLRSGNTPKEILQLIKDRNPSDKALKATVDELVKICLSDGDTNQLAWIKDLPGGDVRDRAVHSALRRGMSTTKSLSEDYWQALLDVAKMATTPESNQIAVFAIIRNWYMEDAAKARQVCEKTNLLAGKWKRRLESTFDSIDAQRK